jgi:hypothetical protein
MISLNLGAQAPGLPGSTVFAPAVTDGVIAAIVMKPPTGVNDNRADVPTLIPT